MSIKLDWRPPEGLIPFQDEEDVAKSGVLKPGFGSKRKRRNQLVQRLKSTRRYAPPVRGGKKKKRRKRLANAILQRRRSATRIGGMKGSLSKHASPVHPGTGTDQSVHGGGGGSLTGHTTAGGENELAAGVRSVNETNALGFGATPTDIAEQQRIDKYRSAWNSLPDLPGERTFWVRPHNLDDLTKEIGKLNRRGQRYFGISEEAGLTLTELDRTHTYTWIDGTTVSFQAVEIAGEEPFVDGFDFLGKIEHLQNEDGSYTNILKVAPKFQDEEGAIPVRFRDAGPDCDLCQRKIYRKETFLVRNQETGEVVQLGRDDLQSYTGYDEAEQFANYTSSWSDLASRLGGGEFYEERIGTGPITYDPITALAQANYMTRTRGFVRTSDPGLTTKMGMASILRRDRQFIEDFGQAGEQDFERAEEIQAWLAGLDDEQLQSDYLWNLKVAATNPYGVDDRQFGLIASAPQAYNRELGLIAERQRQADLDALSDWIGEIKERRDFTNLTITRTNTFEGSFGPVHVYNFIDEDNNQLVWFKSNSPLGVPAHLVDKEGNTFDDFGKVPDDVPTSDLRSVPFHQFEVGDTVSLKATIKAHEVDTFNNRERKQTIITRGKLIE